MNHIAHRNYVDGPLNRNVIPLIDWPSNTNWIISDGHLYSRRTRGQKDGDCALSAIYHLEEITIDAPGPREVLLPYCLLRPDIYDESGFVDLLNNVKTYVRQHHKSMIVIVKLEREFPQFTLTQAFHATTKPKHIEEFLNFAKTLQFDPEHDDAMQRPVGVK